MRNEITTVGQCKRIAIMGGTFDPIHYGHLVAAEAVRNEFEIEKVLFIPTGKPSHKSDKTVTHSEHRYLMSVLATITNPFFEVSRTEIDREGMTYTIDTILELRTLCAPDVELYFITGADAVQEILTWKDAEQLLSLCNFVAVTRPGYHREKMDEIIQKIDERLKIKLFFLEVPALSISSTDIRERVRHNKPIKYLLPEEVEKYIYRTEIYNETFTKESLLETVSQYVSPHRVQHSVGVAEEAQKLALQYGVSPENAYICGLVHDVAKEFAPLKMRKMCEKYHIKIDKTMDKQIDLAHSFVGAAIARDIFHIKKQKMLNAISYHTTARKKMSVLEKIIYIADKIEPNRKPYEGLEQLRLLAKTDLDQAMIFQLERDIEQNKKAGREIHKRSEKALAYFKKEINGGNKK